MRAPWFLFYFANGGFMGFLTDNVCGVKRVFLSPCKGEEEEKKKKECELRSKMSDLCSSNWTSNGIFKC
jgi:hypothetical protein